MRVQERTQRNPLGTKAFFRLDNDWPDVFRPRRGPHACASLPYQSPNGQPRVVQPERYELVPCPNRLRVKESFAEWEQGVENDIFRITREDNEVRLSCEDRKFLEIMETNIHKNDQGNWEMPLPFCHKAVKMPNNRSLAVNRFNSLIRTL